MTGLVDEARQYFDLMRKHYGIRPSMEHYACMVDPLVHAIFQDEAHDFI